MRCVETISVISEPCSLHLQYVLTRYTNVSQQCKFVFLSFSCCQFRILSRLDTLSMSYSTLAPALFITCYPSDSYRDSSRSSKIPSSGNTRSIHFGHTHRSPTSRDNLIAEISRSTTRARPIDVILCQDHSDLRIGGGLGQEGGCSCDRYMGRDGGAGAGCVGCLEGVAINVTGCASAGEERRCNGKGGGEEGKEDVVGHFEFAWKDGFGSK